MPDKERYGLLIAVIVEIVLVDLGTGITMPVLPLFARSLGASVAWTGGIVAVIGVSRTLTDLPAGYLAMRSSRRLLLGVGPLLVCGAAATAALAPAYWVLIPSRLLEGVGMALVNTIAMIVLADTVADLSNRSRIMSLYQAARRGGNGLGPVFGGVVADLLGYRAVYVLYAALALGSFFWALIRLRNVDMRPRQEPEERRAKDGELGRFLLQPAFLVLAAVAFVFFFGRVASRRLIIPIVGQQWMGLSASAIGLALTLATVSSLLTLYFLGNLPDKIGSRPVVVMSGLLTALALAGYALSRSFAVFVLASLFWGFTTGFGGPARNVFLMDIAPRRLYPLALSVYRTVADVGFILGPFLLGLMGAAAGFAAALYMAAGLFVVVSVLFGLLTGGRGGKPNPAGREERERGPGTGGPSKVAPDPE